MWKCEPLYFKERLRWKKKIDGVHAPCISQLVSPGVGWGEVPIKINQIDKNKGINTQLYPSPAKKKNLDNI